LFHTTLATDPNYIPALRKLAVRSFRAADYILAEKYTAQALQRDDSDPETLYLSGIVERALDHLSAAEDALWSSLRLGISPPRALVQLGEIALAKRDYARAEEILHSGLLHSPNNALLQSELAAALRLDNKLPQANRAATEAVSVAPLYPIARAEAWRVNTVQDAGSRILSAKQTWEQAAGDRLQSYLEAASWYWNIKDWASSDFILKAALVRLPSQNISPMVYFYLASNARHQGLASRAEEYAVKAHAMSYTGIFPNRLQDVSVLQEAIAVNPADALAKYLLGNFLFQYGRYAEAAALWRSAEGAGFHDAVLYRNLGIDAWRVNHNLDEGAAWFRKAVDRAPEDYRLYVDLDDIYAQQGTGQIEERERLFANAPADVLDHDSSRLRFALLLIEEGQFDKALALSENHSFKPWELDDDPRNVFVLANLEKGRLALAANDFKRARESFERALEYPSNLGIGRPDKGKDTAVLYWLGVALHKQGDTQGAERAWDSVLDEEGGGDLSRYYAALASKAAGHQEGAVERLRRLADGPLAGRTSSTDYYVAGLAELELQHAEHAREDFHKALEINPFFWQAQIEIRRMKGSGTKISHP
jgi:tetratricopeptide (TPR) repeat protein